MDKIKLYEGEFLVAVYESEKTPLVGDTIEVNKGKEIDIYKVISSATHIIRQLPSTVVCLQIGVSVQVERVED